jgi:hypothetical protein
MAEVQAVMAEVQAVMAEAQAIMAEVQAVMAGLVPAIHATPVLAQMAGTGLAMTGCRSVGQPLCWLV